MKSLELTPSLAMWYEFHSKYFGLREIAGTENNPIIMDFFKRIGYSWVQGDETAWCSAMMNAIAFDLGLERSGKLDARSWLNVGVRVAMDELQIGDTVIFWRESESSWKGHVGLFEGFGMWNNRPVIHVSGGNQSNMAITSPYEQVQFLGGRRLRTLAELEKAA